jgi:hypothetical protein
MCAAPAPPRTPLALTPPPVAPAGLLPLRPCSALTALLAKSADLAVNRGQTDAFAHTMADAFTVARRDSVMPQFTRSVAGAVSQGGPSARLAYGEAIATAIASGGDSQAAVAEATATGARGARRGR